MDSHFNSLPPEVLTNVNTLSIKLIELGNIRYKGI